MAKNSLESNGRLLARKDVLALLATKGLFRKAECVKILNLIESVVAMSQDAKLYIHRLYNSSERELPSTLRKSLSRLENVYVIHHPSNPISLPQPS